MQLILVNTTGSTKTYLSGTISVLANSSTTVTNLSNQLALATDGQLKSDIQNSLVNISDSVNTLSISDALTYLASIPLNVPTIGQATMANSMPVTIASDQTTISVSGTLNTTPSDGTKASYSASVSNFVPPASATDVFTITGSATKTIRITAIGFSATTTAGSGISLGIILIKRSTNDTAGTSTTMTNIKHDINNAAATVTVKAYTANPTLGTTVGSIRSTRIIVPSTGSNGSGTAGFGEWDFGIRPSQCIVLRGAAEQLCINLSGVSITGPLASAFVEWTEE